MSQQKKVLLLILDGVGAAPKGPGNAIVSAQPNTLARLWEVFPRTYLGASGEEVGLIGTANGNSEVGHLTIGSGKVHYQNLLKIDKSIENSLFFSNEALNKVLIHALENKSNIHLMGCLSDGAVHSHIKHFFAVLKFLSQKKYGGRVFIHVFTDGRDTPQKAALKYLKELQAKIDEFRIGEIATICGRMYAMDRNGLIERTKLAYDLITEGKGKPFSNWQEAINSSYESGETDEFVKPILISKDSLIKDNDSILFMNFRPDRAIQLTRMLENAPMKNIFLASMVEYQTGFPNNVLFPKEYISLPLGRVISEAGYTQLRIAESEKFPHVTYFLNGGQPVQFRGEDRIKIPSPSVESYDLKPEMSAYGILNALNQSINSKRGYRFITMNIANGDMVGHTGNLQASIQAMRVVDDVVLRTVRLAQKLGWTVVITADHGNIERMIVPSTGLPNPEHTQNPVPFLIIDNTLRLTLKNKQLRLGTLSDIAPTILKLMQLSQPSTMSGQSLI